MRELVEILGSRRIVAVLSGAKSVREVTAWMNDVEPSAASENVLRTAFQAARVIAEIKGTATARAWFMGTNSHFGFEAPVIVLRDRSESACPDVLDAAWYFLNG
ncbi:MAG: hypothetical protein ABSE64_07985 [Vulcanimicrobiaceae bacterium]